MKVGARALAALRGLVGVDSLQVWERTDSQGSDRKGWRRTWDDGPGHRRTGRPSNQKGQSRTVLPGSIDLGRPGRRRQHHEHSRRAVSADDGREGTERELVRRSLRYAWCRRQHPVVVDAGLQRRRRRRRRGGCGRLGADGGQEQPQLHRRGRRRHRREARSAAGGSRKGLRVRPYGGAHQRDGRERDQARDGRRLGDDRLCPS